MQPEFPNPLHFCLEQAETGRHIIGDQPEISLLCIKQVILEQADRGDDIDDAEYHEGEQR